MEPKKRTQYDSLQEIQRAVLVIQNNVAEMVDAITTMADQLEKAQEQLAELEKQ